MRERLRKKKGQFRPYLNPKKRKKKHVKNKIEKKEKIRGRKKEKILPGVHFTSADRKTKSFKKETYFPNERFLPFKTFSTD